MTRLLGLLGALLVTLPASGNEELDALFDRDVLIIEASQHACYRIDIYVALTNAQRSRGLMFVRELPDFTGMIFVYRQPGIRSMWMKNTFIPLDMLFVKGDGTVSSVVAGTTPHSLESIAAIEPVNFVLELNAGVTGRLEIGTSSRLLFMNLD